MNKWDDSAGSSWLRLRSKITPFCLPSIPQAGVFCRFRRLILITCVKGKPMKAASVKSFSKHLACPSSNLLLSFHYRALAPEINSLVKHHLAACDFCYCEMPLLAFYRQPLKGECRPPDLPINLRILAESILGKDKSTSVASVHSAGTSKVVRD